MSGTVNNGLLVSQISAGQVPKTGKSYAFSVTLTTGITSVVDLTQVKYLNLFKDAQGIFIDNSQNSSACTMVMGVAAGNQSPPFIIPPNSQAILPLYLAIGSPIMNFTGNGTINVQLLNCPVPAQVWGISGSSLPISSGAVLVKDSTVAGLLSAPEGSATGGTAGTASFLAGGLYQSAPSELTSGQQTSMQADPYGSMYVNSELRLPTYSVAINLSVTAAGVLFQLQGSSSKTVRIKKVFTAWEQASTGAAFMQAVRTSAAATSGTSGSLTISKNDTNNPAATAVASCWTAGATLNSLVAPIDYYANAIATTGALVTVSRDYSAGEQSIVLRGTSDYFAITDTSSTTDNTMIVVVWTEE